MEISRNWGTSDFLDAESNGGVYSFAHLHASVVLRLEGSLDAKQSSLLRVCSQLPFFVGAVTFC